MKKKEEIKEAVYKTVIKCSPTIVSFVYKCNGTHEDAEDLIQDVMEALLVKEESYLQKIISLEGYCVGVSKNLWGKELEKRKYIKRFARYRPKNTQILKKDKDEDENFFKLELEKICWQSLMRTNFEHRNIILAFLKGEKDEVIADRFGYTINNIQKKRSLTLRRLRKLIEGSVRYQELMRNLHE